MKLIYIMGAGHIGSTIVDIVLGSHPNIESLGEVNKFHRRSWTLDENRKCSCGETVYECPFWVEVRRKWMEMTGYDGPEEILALQSRFEKTSSTWLNLLWNSVFPSREFSKFQQATAALYQSVHEVGGRKFLVESSLSPRRAYGLTKNPGIDLYLIHMVRDGRGVIWSLKKPGKKIMTKKYVPAPAMRTTRYWISANLQSFWVSMQVPKAKKMLLRYEDFVTDPAATLTRIGDWVGEDLSGLISDFSLTNPNQERHTVGGNRIRMKKDIRIRADFAWEEKLSQKDRKLFWRTAGWLAKRFGYAPK